MKVVKKRKDHTCDKCGKIVKAGELALTESTRKYRGGWNYFVCCKDCAKIHFPREYPKFAMKSGSSKPKRKRKSKPKAPEAAWFDGGTL